MKMQVRVRGHVVLEAWDAVTGALVGRRERDNLVVTLGKQFVAEILAAASGYSTGLTYIAIGIGATTPAAGNTLLANEVFRKIYSSRTVSTNVLIISTLMTAAESTFAIQEVGLFGHSDATATIGTGKLFARSLLSYDNSAGTNNITVTWTLTIE